MIFSEIQKTGLTIEKCAIESSSLSRWLEQELLKKGLTTICVDARKMSRVLSININKTDKNDARLIAEALRCGFYTEVYSKSQEHVELNILMGSRRTLIETATKLKNTIRGHLKAFGIRLGTANNQKFSEIVIEAIKTRTGAVQVGVNGLLASFQHTIGQIQILETKIEALAREDEDVKLLTTIPGVGVITAYTFISSLGDPKRFKNSRAVGAYLGMTPTQYSSGETKKQGRVSKCGDPEVRALLNECAFVILYATKSWSCLKAWGQKIKKKRGHKKAVMAIGRKLAVLMHRMLITRKAFEHGSVKDKQETMQKVC